jgi:deoxyribonuclease-4
VHLAVSGAAEMSSSRQIKCGVHVSIAKSIDLAVDRARERNCDTFQIFTRNPRGWKAKKLVPEEAVQFRNKLRESAMMPAVAHMPYLPNLSCPKKGLYRKSLKALILELERCKVLGIPYLVTHLGSHLGKGRAIGLERLVDAIDAAFDVTEAKTMLLLENTAGTTNSMGSSFEEIQEIIGRVKDKTRIAVCFDTCHAFGAGYDLRDAESVEKTMDELKRTVGLESLKVVHANDSQGELASKRDRHEHIGMGHIGEQGFRAILHNDVFRKLPLILETPIDKRGTDITDLRKLRELSA